MGRDVPEKLKNVRMSGKRTHSQMEDLRIAQVNGETEMVAANRAASINDEHFKKEYADYKINDYDADSYHVAMEARLFNGQTGAKVSKSRVQIFDATTFKQLVNSNGFHGHTTYVLHDPTVESEKRDTSLKQTGNGPGIDDNGKVHGNPGLPVGGTGKTDKRITDLTPATGHNDDGGEKLPIPPVQDPPLLDADGKPLSPIDPNGVDATNLNESDARALYMDLTGKSPDGRWSIEKLKEKIAEVQGIV